MYVPVAFAIAIVTLFMSPAGDIAADDARARAIVKRAIDVTGGEQALAALRAMSCLEKGTYYVNGEEIPYRGSTRIHWPGRFRLAVEDVYTIVLDGQRGWMSAEGKVVSLTAAQLAEVQQQHYARWLASLTPLLDDAFKISSLGPSRINGAAADGIRVTRTGRQPVDLYFDRKTGLLFKSRTSIITDDSRQAPLVEVNLFREYKKTDGVLFPRQLIIYHDDKRFAEANLYDIKLLESLPASDFAKPKPEE